MPIWDHLLQHRGVHSCRPASSTLAAAERHDASVVSPLVAVPRIRSKRLGLTLRLPTLRRKARPSSGDFKLHLATRLDTEAIPHLLRDGHLALACYRYSHCLLGNT
jgi:hypothetical protein